MGDTWRVKIEDTALGTIEFDDEGFAVLVMSLNGQEVEVAIEPPPAPAAPNH